MNDLDPVELILHRPSHGYPVHFRPLSEVPTLMQVGGLQPDRCIVITDENVDKLYSTPLLNALQSAGWQALKVTLPAGEATKSFEYLSTIYDQVLTYGIDRKTPVLALGGGVVGDLAGFAAATLLRGVPLVHLPTTLIGQADSSIGGKTGINHTTGKNLIGSFYQPQLVCADLHTLQSLPDREWSSGLAEVVKYALIADHELFDYLQNNWAAVIDRKPQAVERIVPRSAAIKAEIVQDDEREAGRRAILNFGHTLGHAIEKTSGYGTFTHGEAVALGMIGALHLSHNNQPQLPFEPAMDLITRLPVHHTLDHLSFEDIWRVMQNDKKVKQGRIHYILLNDIGAPYITADIPRIAVREAWRYTRAYAKSRLIPEKS